MGKFIKSTALLVNLLLLSSASYADRAEEAANAACECMEPVNEVMKEMMGAMKSGDNIKMMELSRKMEKNTDVESCMDKVMEKYKKVAEDEAMSARVETHMKKTCPPPLPEMPVSR